MAVSIYAAVEGRAAAASSGMERDTPATPDMAKVTYPLRFTTNFSKRSEGIIATP